MQDEGEDNLWVSCDLCTCWYHWNCLGYKQRPTKKQRLLAMHVVVPRLTDFSFMFTPVLCWLYFVLTLVLVCLTTAFTCVRYYVKTINYNYCQHLTKLAFSPPIKVHNDSVKSQRSWKTSIEEVCAFDNTLFLHVIAQFYCGIYLEWTARVMLKIAKLNAI